MMQMTEKKTKALLERGMKQVGLILQSEDGQLAYVEGAAVRWLDADQREAFMFPDNDPFPVIDSRLLKDIAAFLSLPEYMRNEKLVVWGLEGKNRIVDFIKTVEQAA